MYLTVKHFQAEKPILYGLNNMRAPYGVSITNDLVQANAEGNKEVPEGSFLVSDTAGKVRFLPRTRLKAATATNSTAVSLKTPSFSFKTGDVLYGYSEGTVTLSGTIASGNIVTIEVNNVAYSVAATDTSLATTAAAFVTANAAAMLTAGITVAQVGSTATLSLMGNDSYKVRTACSVGTCSVTFNGEDGYLGRGITPLGTIASIGAANAAGERVVTLASNASTVLPINTIVGVKVEKYLGIYPDALDLTKSPVEHLAPIVEADGVYESNLPYVDLQLKREFDSLRINKYFYKQAA